MQHKHRPSDPVCTNTTAALYSTLTLCPAPHHSTHNTIKCTTNINEQRVSQQGLLIEAQRTKVGGNAQGRLRKKYKKSSSKKTREAYEHSSSQCQPRRCHP